MAFTYKEIPTLALWEPIHRDDWGPEEARHFLERTGFATDPESIEKALDLGPIESCEHFFQPSPLTSPPWLTEKISSSEELWKQARETKDREERQKLNREQRQLENEAIFDLELEWLLRASQPKYGFRAKWDLFLSDVWVVGKRAVRYPGWMESYWQGLAEKSDLPYPEFCKAFSREPAMVRYLDLNQNSKEKPNENFARELLELFTLGEGNYSETDIKEAARAFTGRRIYAGDYREVPGQFDEGEKSLFGETGDWDGDEVIDLIFRQPAARVFLPKEAIRFYLTRTPISPQRLEPLGNLWAEEDFRLDALRRRLFASRAFYSLDFRANRIKSPIEFYIGSLQRFGLQPVPVRQYSTRILRDMGQELFEPPNVRGWIGGEAWINAGKLAARRQAATEVFEPIPEKRLNADDQYRIEREIKRDGSKPFRVEPENLTQLTGESSGDIIRFIREQLLITSPEPAFYRRVRDQLGNHPYSADIEEVLITVLQSPQYQIS